MTAVGADDLDVIVERSTSADIRGRAYDRLTSVEFSTIAAKLAKLPGTHQPEYPSGIGPRTKQPWFESDLSEENQIFGTLCQLWMSKIHEQDIKLIFALLADTTIVKGRHLALSEVSSRLRSSHLNPRRPLTDSEQLSINSMLTRLDLLARDPKQPNSLRLRTIELLFEHGDPNKYLDLAIDLSSTEDTRLRRAEAFRFCTPKNCLSSRLSGENRTKFLRHAYRLLEEVDDGNSGEGHFLAIHTGQLLGIPPVRSRQPSFAPDSNWEGLGFFVGSMVLVPLVTSLPSERMLHVPSVPLTMVSFLASSCCLVAIHHEGHDFPCAFDLLAVFLDRFVLGIVG